MPRPLRRVASVAAEREQPVGRVTDRDQSWRSIRRAPEHGNRSLQQGDVCIRCKQVGQITIPETSWVDRLLKLFRWTQAIIEPLLLNIWQDEGAPGPSLNQIRLTNEARR